MAFTVRVSPGSDIPASGQHMARQRGAAKAA
jgi:hypothetical protein